MRECLGPMHAEQTEESEGDLMRCGSQNTWQRFSGKKVAGTSCSFAEPLFPICSQLVLGFYLLRIYSHCNDAGAAAVCEGIVPFSSLTNCLSVIFHRVCRMLMISRRCGCGRAPVNFGIRPSHVDIPVKLCAIMPTVGIHCVQIVASFTMTELAAHTVFTVQVHMVGLTCMNMRRY